MYQARSRGLVVEAEDSWLRGRGFKHPTEETIFQAQFIWIKKKPGAKIEWKLTWHCCICCNPAKGGVDFKAGWLIKSSFIIKDEMKLVSKTGPNSHKKNFNLPPTQTWRKFTTATTMKKVFVFVSINCIHKTTLNVVTQFQVF